MRWPFIFFLVLFCLSSLAQAPYSNPVIRHPGVPPEAADQFILKWNGEYYMYVSGDPITSYHSTDLVHWDYIGPVLSSSTHADAWNQADVWAPEVVYRNGKFYMYYTASRKSGDWRIGEMARRIGVAVSESPRGPFVDSGSPVTVGWGIDGTIFKDPDGGEEHLFYSYLYEPRLPGAGIVVDRLLNWNRVVGNPSHVVRGTEAWEDKDGDPNNGSIRYTNEGPTVLKRNGQYYMMYSGGSWDLPTYALGYATSRSISNGLQGWTKVVPPLLRATPFVDGPGHNALVKAPNNVDDINFYHARVVPFLEPWNRLPFADRLYWNDDRMYADQPTVADKSLPDKPLFSAFGIGIDGNLAAEYRKGRIQSVIPQVGEFTNFLYEVNLRTYPKEVSARANQPLEVAAGAIIFQSGPQNVIYVSLGRRTISLLGKLDGAELAPVISDLPPNFIPEALHQLLITRNGDLIAVQLDGVNGLSHDYPLRGRPGRFGTFSSGMPVEFGHTSLTPWYEDFFNTSSANGWHQMSGTWLSQDGAFQQVSGSARAVALKGDNTLNYEFSASVRLTDADSDKSKIGVVAASARESSVLAGFDHNIWPFARFWVQHLVAGEVKRSFGVGLPRGFDYNVFHTIRVVKQGSAFTFFLDGKETAATHVELADAVPGLFTEGARAAFHDATMKLTVVPSNLVLNGGFETEQWDGGKATVDNPWTLSGAARPNECCGHSGLRKLMIVNGNGSASQIVSGLTPGEYSLHAWAMKSGKAEGTLEAGNIKAQVESATWQLVMTEFSVPSGQTSATITFSGLATPGAEDFVAIDDVYLYKK